MNNKGFAVSGILYTIFMIFLVTISIMLFNLQNRKTILDELKIDAVNAVESDNNYEYLLNEINSLKLEINNLKSETSNLVKTLWSGTATVGDSIDLSDSYRNYKLLLFKTNLGTELVNVSGSYLTWSGMSGNVNVKDTYQTTSLNYGMAKINSETNLTIMNEGFIYDLYNVSSKINSTTENSLEISLNTSTHSYSPRQVYALYGIK